MECSKTKLLANKIWPFYRETKKGLCCYQITVNSKSRAAEVVADAETKPDYVRRSQFFVAPNNNIRVYVYFRKT